MSVHSRWTSPNYKCVKNWNFRCAYLPWTCHWWHWSWRNWRKRHQCVLQVPCKSVLIARRSVPAHRTPATRKTDVVFVVSVQLTTKSRKNSILEAHSLLFPCLLGRPVLCASWFSGPCKTPHGEQHPQSQRELSLHFLTIPAAAPCATPTRKPAKWQCALCCP